MAKITKEQAVDIVKTNFNRAEIIKENIKEFEDYKEIKVRIVSLFWEDQEITFSVNFNDMSLLIYDSEVGGTYTGVKKETKTYEESKEEIIEVIGNMIEYLINEMYADKEITIKNLGD